MAASADLATSSLEGCKRFTGQTFIITGGAQGIGFGIAQRLFSEGKPRNLIICHTCDPFFCTGAAHGALFDVNEDALKAAVAV